VHFGTATRSGYRRKRTVRSTTSTSPKPFAHLRDHPRDGSTKSALPEGSTRLRRKRTFRRLRPRREAKVHRQPPRRRAFPRGGARLTPSADIVGSAAGARSSRRTARRLAAPDGARLREGRARDAASTTACNRRVPRRAGHVRCRNRLRAGDADGGGESSGAPRRGLPPVGPSMVPERIGWGGGTGRFWRTGPNVAPGRVLGIPSAPVLERHEGRERIPCSKRTWTTRPARLAASWIEAAPGSRSARRLGDAHSRLKKGRPAHHDSRSSRLSKRAEALRDRHAPRDDEPGGCVATTFHARRAPARASSSTSDNAVRAHPRQGCWEAPFGPVLVKPEFERVPVEAARAARGARARGSFRAAVAAVLPHVVLKRSQFSSAEIRYAPGCAVHAAVGGGARRRRRGATR